MRRLQAEITSREFTELLAADNLGLVPDPWLQSGVICATIMRSQGATDVSPQDFIPGGEEEIMDDDDIEAELGL